MRTRQHSGHYVTVPLLTLLSSHRELLSPLVSPLRCFLHHIGALHEEEILVPSNQHLSTLARAPCR